MFLNSLWQASWQGAVLVALVAIGLRIVPSVHPKAKAWLWRLVFVKLAIGLIPLSGVTLKILPPQPTPSYIVSSETPLLQPIPQPASHTDQIFILWAIGAGLLGAYGITSAVICRRKFLNGQPACDDLVKEVLAVAGRFGRAASPKVLISRSAETAMVTGCLRPTIILPPDLDSHDDLQMVIAHEMAHVAHRDLEWSSFAAIVQVMFFFHPLVWVAHRQLRSAQESAADFAAIQKAKTSPRSYGDMLLRLSIEPGLSPYPGLAVRGSVRELKKRLIELAYVQKRPRFTTVAATVMLVSGAAALLPAYQLTDRDEFHKEEAADLIAPAKGQPARQVPRRSASKNQTPSQVHHAKQVSIAPRRLGATPTVGLPVSAVAQPRLTKVTPIASAPQLLPIGHRLAGIQTVGGSGKGLGVGRGVGGGRLDPVSSSTSSSSSSSSSGLTPGSYRYSYKYDHSYEYSNAAKGVHEKHSESIRNEIGSKPPGDQAPPDKHSPDDF